MEALNGLEVLGNASKIFVSIDIPYLLYLCYTFNCAKTCDFNVYNIYNIVVKPLKKIGFGGYALVLQS